MDTEPENGPGHGPESGNGVKAPELGLAQIITAHAYGVPLDSLMAATRKDRRVAEARQVAMYLAHVVFRMSLAEIARGFGRDRTTARHACRHVEELREDPGRDRLIAWLEATLRLAASRDAAPAAGRGTVIDASAEVLS